MISEEMKLESKLLAQSWREKRREKRQGLSPDES